MIGLFDYVEKSKQSIQRKKVEGHQHRTSSFENLHIRAYVVQFNSVRYELGQVG